MRVEKTLSGDIITLDTLAYDSMNGVVGKHVLGDLSDIRNPEVRDNMSAFADALRRLEIDVSAGTLRSRTDLPLTDKDGNKYRAELMSVSPNYWGKGNCYAFGLAYHALGSKRMEDMAVFKVDTCQAALVA